MKIKLTKKIVDTSHSEIKDVRLMDTDVEGFGIKITPENRKIFFLRYRTSNKRCYLSIGRYGQPWTVEAARKEARRLLGEVASGINPADSRKNKNNITTVRQLCDQYIRVMEEGTLLTRFGTPKKKSTLSTDKGRIKRHINPLLGKIIISSLTRRDVEDFRDNVTRGKTAIDEKTGQSGRSIVKGGAGTATRTLGLLGSIMSYAIDLGIRTNNPVHGVRRAADGRRNRAISKNEYKLIGEGIELSRKNGVNSLALNAITVLLLTGCRKGEVTGLCWQEIDLDNSCLRLEDTKTGKQIRPIGQVVSKILSNLPKLSNKYVFPTSSNVKPTSALPKVWNGIRERTKLSDVTMHTFRHGFASVAAEMGYSELTIAGMLGHKASSITSRYVHVVDRALVDAANIVSNEIAERTGLI